jgi:hypothetical protein
MSAERHVADRAEVLASLATQIEWCHRLDAPFTAGLVGAIRANIERDGALATLVVPWAGKPLADALPIRLAGASHALVRAGSAPELASMYPPAAAPAWDDPAIATLLDDVARTHRDAIAAFISHPPQTNEVGRSAILMPGYAEIARATGLPLRVLELGASAGLNLNWHRYAYRLGSRAVGAADAALTLAPEWRGTPPPVAALPDVRACRGCDRSPIDLARPGAVERLVAYVWPDHPERVRRLEAAIAIARAAPPSVDAEDAGVWLDARLAEPSDGVATVVAHSIVWQYFAKPTAERARHAIERAGAAATATRPFAWLAFEQRTTDAPPDVRLTLWPGGDCRTVARAHPHGAWVEWLA